MAVRHLTVDQVRTRRWTRQLSRRPPDADAAGVRTQVTSAAVQVVAVRQPMPGAGATAAVRAAETLVRNGTGSPPRTRCRDGEPRVSRGPESPPVPAGRLDAERDRRWPYLKGNGDA